MEHRGEILRDVLAELGVSQRQLSRDLKVHHNTVANYLERSDLSEEIISKISKQIRYDVASRIPSLKKQDNTEHTETAAPLLTSASDLYLSQNFAANVPESLPACQKALMSLQAAHISLLHEHLNLVRKYQLSEVA